MVGQRNRHFSSEEWVDFVNGVLAEEQAQAMQSHLDSECSMCRKVLDGWQRVREVAQREREYEVPGWAVKHVQNAFAMTRLLAPQRSFSIPRLVFDSLWQPTAVGVRNSAGAASRRTIYRAKGILVDLQMEPVPNSERVNVAGQVSSSIVAGEGFPEIPVVVSSRDRKLAEVSTNRFGEFQVDFVPEENLHISFVFRGGEELSIPLEGTHGRISHWS